jgi:hypothetical protein
MTHDVALKAMADLELLGVEIDRLKRIEHAATLLIIEMDKQSHHAYPSLGPLRRALIAKPKHHDP